MVRDKKIKQCMQHSIKVLRSMEIDLSGFHEVQMSSPTPIIKI